MKRHSIISVVSLIVAVQLVWFNLSRAQDDVFNVGQGSLRILPDNGNTIDRPVIDLPLKHTTVNASISGFLSRVTVTQHFENNQNHPVEAVYVFPLPDQAAVDSMTMTIGEKVIKGVIKERHEAEKIYDEARSSGKTASLLTQERPNIFTQSVANIIPGDRIDITISYVQDLKYDDGQYEFNFPMVVGPRFIPGTPIGHSGGGWAHDTDQVPDASRISPPVLKPGVRSGHDIEVHVTLDAGLPIRDLQSPSHQINLEYQNEQSATVSLRPSDTVPNKDFILRYAVSGKLPEAALLTHADDRGGFFSLMIQPPVDVDIREVTPKEMIFVVDCSGSMMGAPIEKAKEAMRKCIAGMNPKDSFQIIQFSNSASGFSPRPVPNTSENVKRGLAFIDQMSGSGGTQMIEGIKASLDYPADPARLRIVFFMTDGYIGNETEILAAIEQRLRNARLFSFGVGSSVNHYLLDRMAEVGRGFVQYVRPDEDTQRAVDLFYHRIQNPLLTDISVDWNGLDIKDVYPAVIPDLFSAQPVILHGRYGRAGSAAITVHGKYHGSDWSQRIDIELPETEPDHDVLASIWARSRIKMLMSRMFQRNEPEIVREITDLAIQYRLMSQYTAFVAVSEEIRNKDGRLETVQIPVEIPDMVSYEGVFGDSDASIVSKAIGYVAGGSAKGLPAPSQAIKSKSYSVAQESRGMDVMEELEASRTTQDAPRNKNEEKSDHQVVHFQIGMVSGGVTRTSAEKALDAIMESLKTAISNQTTGSMILQLTVDRYGNIQKVDVLKNSFADKILEKTLIERIQKDMKLDTGDGSVTLEIRV